MKIINFTSSHSDEENCRANEDLVDNLAELKIVHK